MLDAVQSTPASIRSCASGRYSAFSVKSCLMLSNPPPTSIRSCASGHYSAFLVKSCLMLSNPPPLQSGLVRLAITVPSLSSHAWWCPIHPHFNQVLCIWPLQCLLSQVILDDVQSTPHFNQVLCVWPLQCLLCQVMLDDVQSTPASIRSCASGHYSAVSVKSCLMLSNPPPLQSGLVRLAITVPSLSSPAWWYPIHPPLQSGLVRLAITVPSLSSHAWWYPIHPPLQSGLVLRAITVPSLSSHAWWCPIHPHINPVLGVWPLQCLLCQVMLDDVQSTPTSIRSCASGHYSAFSVKSCLMMSNPPPHQSGLVHLAITVPSLSSHAWCCPIHPHFNPVLCVWPLQCLLCQVMLDAVQSTPASIRSCAYGHYSAFFVRSCLMLSNPPLLQSGLVRMAITVPSLSSHAWCCPIHPPL